MQSSDFTRTATIGFAKKQQEVKGSGVNNNTGNVQPGSTWIQRLLLPDIESKYVRPPLFDDAERQPVAKRLRQRYCLIMISLC